MTISRSSDLELTTLDCSRTGRYVFPSLEAIYRAGEPVVYALLRVGFGLIILTHGLPKALGTPHGSMADPMAGATSLIANVLGLPFAPQLAVVAMLLETAGAIAVAVGIGTRLIAAVLAIEMVVICFIHAPTFAWIDRGFEYPLMLSLVALYLSVRGGGPYSIDRLLSKEV